jgi:hypothetical protein
VKLAITYYILQLPAQICAKVVSPYIKSFTYSLKFTGIIIIIIIIIIIELTIQLTCWVLTLQWSRVRSHIPEVHKASIGLRFSFKILTITFYSEFYLRNMKIWVITRRAVCNNHIFTNDTRQDCWKQPVIVLKNKSYNMARFILEEINPWPNGTKKEKFMIHRWYSFSSLQGSEGENISQILRINILNSMAKINIYSSIHVSKRTSRWSWIKLSFPLLSVQPFGHLPTSPSPRLAVVNIYCDQLFEAFCGYYTFTILLFTDTQNRRYCSSGRQCM